MPPPQAHTGLPAHLKKFRDEAIGAGFEEPVLRRWSAHEVVSLHCHPFDVRAVVVEGEMQLTVDGHTQTLHPGDTFSLHRDKPHEERYGPQGAAYWVARRGDTAN